MASLLTRRSILALLGTVAGPLAGCSAFENHPELLVFNGRAEPVVASIAMKRVGDDSPVYSETFRLTADEDVRRQLGLSNDLHRIATEVEGGPAREMDWEPGGEGCCLEVHLGDDVIEYRVRAH